MKKRKEEKRRVLASPIFKKSIVAIKRFQNPSTTSKDLSPQSPLSPPKTQNATILQTTPSLNQPSNPQITTPKTSTLPVVGVELLSACQGLDLLRPLCTTAPLEAVHALVRKHVRFVCLFVCLSVCLSACPPVPLAYLSLSSRTFGQRKFILVLGTFHTKIK